MDIVFHVPGLPFDGRTPYERDLGGSETAAWLMAKGLAQHGHRVRVYCSGPRVGMHEGVEYCDLANWETEFVKGSSAQVLIASRGPDVLADARLQVAHRVCWLHDVYHSSQMPYFFSHLAYVDEWWFNSGFHRQLMLDTANPWQLDGSFWDAVNPIDLDLVAEAKNGTERNWDEPLLLYTSRPDRGLVHLMGMWPEIRRRHPKARLGVAFYKFPKADDTDLAQLHQLVQRWAEENADNGVMRLGGLSKPALYRLMHEGVLWVYPTDFWEISCLGAIEAQACGLPIVSSNYCALEETVGEHGLLLNGDPQTQEYRDAFVNGVSTLLHDHRQWQDYQQRGLAHAQRYDYRRVSGLWAERMTLRGWDTAPIAPNYGPTHKPEGLSVCIIAKVDTDRLVYSLARCLESVRPWADQIVVCDTGSERDIRHVCGEQGAEYHQIDWLEADGLGNFAAARNRSLEFATQPWVMWIDTDEVLIGGQHLYRYLRPNGLKGYQIAQKHFRHDNRLQDDWPYRIIRNDGVIRFYGCVHEQPQNDPVNPLNPFTVLMDIFVMHDGYVADDQQDRKYDRNHPLVLKDARVYPERKMWPLNTIRDEVIEVGRALDRGEPMTEERIVRLVACHDLYREHFGNWFDYFEGRRQPRNGWHQRAFEWTQQALCFLALAHRAFQIKEVSVLGVPRVPDEAGEQHCYYMRSLDEWNEFRLAAAQYLWRELQGRRLRPVEFKPILEVTNAETEIRYSEPVGSAVPGRAVGADE